MADAVAGAEAVARLLGPEAPPLPHALQGVQGLQGLQGLQGVQGVQGAAGGADLGLDLHEAQLGAAAARSGRRLVLSALLHTPHVWRRVSRLQGARVRGHQHALRLGRLRRVPACATPQHRRVWARPCRAGHLSAAARLAPGPARAGGVASSLVSPPLTARLPRWRCDAGRL